MISFINVHISHYCPNRCWFCEVKEHTRMSHDEFTRWKELRDFLIKLDLDEKLTINFVCGEPSLFPDLIRKAKKEIDKIKRIKPVEIIYSTIVCGINPENILELIKEGTLNTEAMMLSYDGVDDRRHHYCPEALEMLAPILPCVTTALDRDTVENIESILDEIIKYRANSWSYYFLIDNMEYSDDDFIESFKNKFLPTIYKYRSLIPIYNITDFKIGKTGVKNLICNYGKEVTVTITGKVLPCGMMDTRCQYTEYIEPTADLSDDIDYINQELDKMRALCLQDVCDYTSCNYMHCVECSLAAKIRPYTIQQQCALRHLEFEAYQKYMM